MLSSFDVRLHAIRLENLKNVTHGEICLTKSSTITGANILGLYGQNGSGKTALIDALSIFKYAVMNRQLPEEYAGQINTAADYAKLTYIFHISQKETRDCYTVTYELKLRKETDPDAQATAPNASRVIIFDEVLYLALQGKTRQIRKGRVIDTISDVLPFTPKSKFKTLTGGGQKMALELAFEKGSQQNQSRSFIFSPKLREIFERRSKDESINHKEKEEILITLSVIQRLVMYANSELFVITNQANNMVGLDTLILGFRLKEGNHLMSGQLPLILGASIIRSDVIPLIHSILEKINIVLQQIIPGLTVRIKELGKGLTQDSQNGTIVQLVSLRKDKEIPLKYESDGIKKIVSVLSLFIALYNKRSITVAIDELDSGIFEYLLGELLRILSEKGKGQLIFTCHNLRPLETLPQEFIVFTSTDPNERYRRLKAVKSSNNLRDIYYREILVGDGHLYNRTKNPEISWAFREAWEEEA